MADGDSTAPWPPLAVLVPYRDRPRHLRTFLGHMVRYFRRDKLDRHIPVRLVVAEQAPGGPFNKGRLLNAAFAWGRGAAAYVCFHDVDWLPLWADYRWPEQPTRLITHGPGRYAGPDGVAVHHRVTDLFGGVVLMQCGHVERVNGFSNAYPGWGFEDLDLRDRCRGAGLGVAARDGTYQGLPHPHAGLTEDGSALSTEARANAARYAENAPLYATGRGWETDGLHNHGARLLRQAPLMMREAAGEACVGTHLLIGLEG